MDMKKTLCALVATATFGLAGCIGPSAPIVKDFTGDGIPDIMISASKGGQLIFTKFLFIGQKDGSYIRAEETDSEGVRYFKTDKGEIYFFNGQYYVQSPQKQK
jgi:hypothetical protein